MSGFYPLSAFTGAATLRVTGLTRFAQLLVAATYVLIVFGASVRVNGAGLACPDWPLCFGEVIPTIDFGVAFEFGHRVLAGLISLGFVALGLMIFRRRKELGSGLLYFVGFTFFALSVQVTLGGLTVLELLAEWTVTSHLLGGNTVCLSFLLIALALSEADTPVSRASVTWVQRLAIVAFSVVVPLQLALGGLVSSSHAGLVCASWPACNGSVWFPTVQGLVGLQVMHRIAAYGLAALALGVFAATRGHERLGRPAMVLIGIVLLQVVLGVANVLWRLPVEVTLAHSAGAAAIVLTTTWLNWEAWRAPVTVVQPGFTPALEAK